MNIRAILAAALMLPAAINAQSADTAQRGTAKALLVYDKIDDATRFYIETLRQRLQETGIPFDEIAVDTAKGRADASAYQRLVVYSRVMAFTMMAPTKKWLLSAGDLSGRKILLLVTANRWLAEKQRKDFAKLIAKRHGSVVDAVSMATSKMSQEEKAQKIHALVKSMPQ